jgi:hypothetical protein
MEKEIKAYKEILEVLNKYREITIFDYNHLEQQSKYHLFGLELKERYGLNVEPRNIRSLDWNTFGEYLSIGLFGEKYRRTIAWSDDGKQPEDELMIRLSFCTGAYIFGDDYPTELFQQFWQELKTYNPKYSDTVNKNLYFSIENGAKIFNEFKDILKKYYELNREDAKKRKIKKLQDELEKLTPKSNNQRLTNKP